MTGDERRRFRIAVIGAGFGGIATAIRLRQHGCHDFVIFDRGTEVGGTWQENSYPGCACDVPSQRLADTWRESVRAYRGTTVTGFPNLFMLLGPNTGLGHTSVVFMIECQVNYLLCMLRHLDGSGRNSNLWPGYTWQYWWSTRRFDPAGYRPVAPATTPTPGGVR